MLTFIAVASGLRALSEEQLPCRILIKIPSSSVSQHANVTAMHSPACIDVRASNDKMPTACSICQVLVTGGYARLVQCCTCVLRRIRNHALMMQIGLASAGRYQQRIGAPPAHNIYAGQPLRGDAATAGQPQRPRRPQPCQQ